MDDCYFKSAHYPYRGQIFHIFNIKNNDKKFIEESYGTLFNLVELFGFRFIKEDCHMGRSGVERDRIIISFIEKKYSIFKTKNIALNSVHIYDFNTRYELFEYLHKEYPTFYQPNLKLAIHET